LTAPYLDLTHFIRAVIHEKSKGPFVWGTNNPPLWLEALITHWHKNRCTVITLNYDTLIERVASSTYWTSRSESIFTGDLYPIDLTPAGQRGTTTIISQSNTKTFRLFKLHGSINWFYSGRTQFYGEHLYFVPCEGGVDGSFDTLMGRDPEQLHWDHVGDKMALIIPPILDKTVFFQHESLRSMWLQAGQAIRDATKIVCMGYSLPTGDLTMGQFLKTSAPKQPIPFYLVDVRPKVEHFQSVVGKSLYDFQQADEDLGCVPRFVVNHCISNRKDQAYVVRMTQWPNPKEGYQPPSAIKTTERPSRPIVGSGFGLHFQGRHKPDSAP